MNLVQITPGAGGMYCSNCLRDNALVQALRRRGHSVLMVPLYLPLTLDEEDASGDTPVFFGGVNSYLQQKSALFRRAPAWLRATLDSPALLRWAGRRAGSTTPAEVADLTLSMLRGEEGFQARELENLVNWLKQGERPDAIVLSNVLLAGLARRLKQELDTRVVCFLKGEEAFMDALPEATRAPAWQLLADRAAQIDRFIVPSQSCAERMAGRLRLRPEHIAVVPSGLNLGGFAPSSEIPEPPVLGFFARLTREKGLDVLVDAFITLKQRNCVPALRLRAGGGCRPHDEPFLQAQRGKLRTAGLLDAAEFLPNLDRAAKIQFYQSLSVLSVPAVVEEDYGYFIVEALACGVPVVQPRQGAFVELIETTGGGALYEARTADALPDALEAMLLNPIQRRTLGAAGRRVVQERFGIDAMAQRFIQELQEVI